MFIAYFLELNKTQKNKYNIILIMNGLSLLLIIATIVMLATKNTQFLKIPSVLGYINFIVVIFLILWATFSNLKVNKFNSIYVFMAFLPNCIWALSLILKALKIIPQEMYETPINWTKILNQICNSDQFSSSPISKCSRFLHPGQGYYERPPSHLLCLRSSLTRIPKTAQTVA